jgi:hypothetical protein
MTPQTLDSDFSDTVRAELGAIGTRASRLERRQRRSRLAVAGALALGVAAATTGAALTVGGFPGSTTVTRAGDDVTVEQTGTATIELGRGEGANTVILDVTCLGDRGSIHVPTTSGFEQDADGSVHTQVTSATWNCAEVSRTVHISDGYLADGATSITITADPGTRWKAVARYGQATTSDWGVNANGQTFGEPNGRNGFPDLQGVQASNGRIGWALTRDMNVFHACGDAIPVYESDGTTVIGEFVFGDPGACPTATPVPTP